MRLRPRPPYKEVRVRRFLDLNHEGWSFVFAFRRRGFAAPGFFRASPYPPPKSSASADWLARGQSGRASLTRCRPGGLRYTDRVTRTFLALENVGMCLDSGLETDSHGIRNRPARPSIWW